MKSIEQQTVPDILLRFAQLLGTTLKNNKLAIPEKFGTGYCIGYVLNEDIQLMISNYELNEDLMVNNPDINTEKRRLFFKFQHILPKTQTVSSVKHFVNSPSVLIATSRLNTDDVISIHTNTATINIEIDANYLNGLFDQSQTSPVLQSLLQNTQPLLFEQIIFPSLQKIVDEMVAESVNDIFKLFFLRIKAEELICRLLIELQKRDEKHLYPLNSRDIEIIYKMREQMLAQIDTPPVIKALAVYACMSPTKLKRLFKQIFGNSIFNYYQVFRIQEAARLLKEEKLSVSDAGYRLGFTNLSHFSKVFAAQIGMKPKRYSQT